MKKNSLIFFTLLLAFIFRTWQLSILPKSMSMDEVTFGYAAYSILHTGMDEYAKVVPLAFRGMGDYKPPVDVYLKVPFIWLFGLNEFSIRFVGVLMGTLTVYYLYRLLKNLNFSSAPTLLTLFWLSLSGWHIFYSRGGYEAITALFFLTAGLNYFVYWIKKKDYKGFLLLLIAFCLSFWSYHSERVFVPVLFLCLLIVYWRNFRNVFCMRKQLLIALGLLSFFCIPFSYELFIGKGIMPRVDDLWFAKNISNVNVFSLSREWIGQYLQYFDLRFIFWKSLGLTPAGYPDISLLNFSDAIIFFTGLYSIILNKDKAVRTLSFSILFLGPVPGAFARGDPSAIRILTWIPSIGIIMASGFSFILKRAKYAKMWLSVWIIGAVLAFVWFFNFYTNVFDKYYADLWHYGYKEAALYICGNYNKYEKVILTNKYGIEISRITTIPHYYILFHCGYDPKTYQRSRSLFNIEIRQPQWRLDSEHKNYLLIGSPRDFPDDFDRNKIFRIIYFPNGKEALYFVET